MRLSQTGRISDQDTVLSKRVQYQQTSRQVLKENKEEQNQGHDGRRKGNGGRLFNTADIPPTQKKHLAYWVLGYKLFGVNFIDLACLKWEDINNQYWKYKRSKTGVGSASGKPVPEAAMKILKQYDTGGKYILDVLNDYDDSADRIHTRLRNYRANMRRTFRVLSKRINFTDDRYITWYTVRLPFQPTAE